MRTCLLHIGTPKAGSTTLQGFLGVYRQALAGRGVDLPDFGFGDVVRGPIALAGALPSEDDPARPATEPWRWLDAHLQRTDGDLCISREAFCEHFAKKRRLDFVAAFFTLRSVRLKIVAYVRDHVGFLNATYTQQAKKLRLTQEFGPWLDAALSASNFRNSYWQMFRHIPKLESATFTLRPLDQVAGPRLVEDFAALLGCPDLDVSGFDASPFRNATPGPKAVAAGLIVGRALAERGLDPDSMPQLARGFEAAAARRGWSEAPFFGPDEAEAARVDAFFAQEDARLARRFWRGRWADHVKPTRRTRNALDLARASAADRAEIEDLAREIIAQATLGPVRRKMAGLGLRLG